LRHPDVQDPIPSMHIWKFPYYCINQQISSKVPQVQKGRLGWGLGHPDVATSAALCQGRGYCY